jgi:hypothetical protein
MGFICLVLTFLLIHYSWNYYQFHIYLILPFELKRIMNISHDDLLQSNKLITLSKCLFLSSAINLSLLTLCLLPFLFLYFLTDLNYISLLMKSYYFWLVSFFLTLNLFIINRKK